MTRVVTNLYLYLSSGTVFAGAYKSPMHSYTHEAIHSYAHSDIHPYKQLITHQHTSVLYVVVMATWVLWDLRAQRIFSGWSGNMW